MSAGETDEHGPGLGNFLRKDLVGGVLLLVAMLSALVIANSPLAESYSPAPAVQRAYSIGKRSATAGALSPSHAP